MSYLDTEPPLFQYWYKNKLAVTGYPVISEITAPLGKYKGYNVFINVSDEYWMDYHAAIWQEGKQAHWFPLGEMHNDIGLSSIYGALWVLYQAWERDLSVLIHCHAGINRSQTIRACFYYMMEQEHLYINDVKTHVSRDNMLLYNCKKHLPERVLIEKWLTAVKKAFENPDKYCGGMYDWTLREAELQNEK